MKTLNGEAFDQVVWTGESVTKMRQMAQRVPCRKNLVGRDPTSLEPPKKNHEVTWGPDTSVQKIVQSASLVSDSRAVSDASTSTPGSSGSSWSLWNVTSTTRDQETGSGVTLPREPAFRFLVHFSGCKDNTSNDPFSRCGTCKNLGYRLSGRSQRRTPLTTRSTRSTRSTT